MKATPGWRGAWSLTRAQVGYQSPLVMSQRADLYETLAGKQIPLRLDIFAVILTSEKAVVVIFFIKVNK